MLDVFSTEESLKCLAMNTHWGASKTQYSEVWIKSDLDAPTIANCIKEEMYNASGVPGDPIGLPSLFYSDGVFRRTTGATTLREFFRSRPYRFVSDLRRSHAKWSVSR